MSEEERNVAILKEAYRLWHETKGKSVNHWISICADAIEFGSIAQNLRNVPYMTTYEDVAALAKYFAGLSLDWEMIEFRTENFVAQGDRVVMLGRCSWRAKRNGVVVWTPKADSFRMKNGKIVEYYEFFDTAQVRDAIQG
jgi:ketosteroid isomerase-like protein